MRSPEEQLFAATVIFLWLVYMSMGVASAFFGYRWFRIMIVVLGVATGAFLAGLSQATVNLGSDPGPFVLLLGGVVGGFVFYYGYFLGVMLVGAALAGGLAAVLSAIGSGSPQPAIVFVAVLLGAWLALRFQKLFIVIVTAFQGATALTYGLAFASEGGIGDPTFRWQRFSGEIAGEPVVTILVWLLLGLAGIAFQYWDTARRAGDEDGSPSIGDELGGLRGRRRLAAAEVPSAVGEGVRSGGIPVHRTNAARPNRGGWAEPTCSSCSAPLLPADIDARFCPNCRATLQPGAPG